ncbi:MAG: DHH family phosphoesterase [Oscillospiraceae bacterium]|nr:DHH family phosphoesterase [Oscillospiraceae bacterium]
MQLKMPRRLTAAAALLILSGMTAVLMLLTGGTPRGWAVIFVTVLFLLSLIWLAIELLRLRRNVLRYFSHMNRALKDTLFNAPEHMPVPVAILDDNRQIIWYNRSFFSDVACGEELYGQPLSAVMPLRAEQITESSYGELECKGKYFRVSRTRYRHGKNTGELLCFQDETQFVNLRRLYMDTRPCVIMIVVDNYADLFNSTRQSERASVMAALEVLYDRFLEGTDSIFCHLDEDRFMVLTVAKHVLEMERAHFPLLDEARKIKVGSSSLTLSIGIGRSGDNLEQNEKYAQQSLDMALGRGGDQVAIKTNDGFTFYGGVSKGIEHRNKARNRAVARDLQKLMKRCKHVYIMGHRASDLDAVGASVGIAFVAQQTGIPYNIVIRKESSLAKLLIERVEKEMPDVMITPETARAIYTQEDLVVIVDTFSRDIVEDAELYAMAKHVVVIDHHRQMVNYLENTTLKLHDPYASSAAELVAGMIQYFDWRDQMPQFTAEALLAGIMLDTKNFIMQTGVHTIEIAAYLRERGADPVAVKTLFEGSLDAYRQRSRMVADAEVYRRYAVTLEEEEVPEIQIIASQTADELLGIENVDASFVIFPRGGMSCISARSLGAMNVQVVMERLGGGGHQTQAATQRKDCSVAELREMLLDALDAIEAEGAAAEQAADAAGEPEEYAEPAE